QGRREAAAAKFGVVGDTYRMRGDKNSAIVTYEKVAELSPLDLNTRTRLIDLLKEYGNIERALEHYLAMGEGYYQLAQVDKARETYQEALKLARRGAVDDIWKGRVLRLMADIDMQRFDWKRAISAYRELRELEPEDEGLAITLVDLHFRVGQPVSAVRELDKYLSQLVQSGRSTKVVAILEDMVEQRPSDANLVDRLSRLYAQQKRLNEAVKLLDKLGEAQLEAGESDKAVKTIEKIVKLKPANVESYRQLLSQLKRS
ncbi:MAG: tetratricopeptide repeat protein, partial [Anaerolineae bacterium]